MGLDMYLNARKYIGWKEMDPIKKKVQKAIEDCGVIDINYVQGEAMYWRKANAIHNWFVHSVQGGNDDCGIYDVDKEKLGELKELIDQAIATKDTELLPTASGFFFGNTDYDEYYWEVLKNTSERLKELLGEDYKGWNFQYQSSW